MNFLFGYFSSGHFVLHLLSYKIVRNQGSWLQPVEAFGFIVRGHIKIHNKCYCPQLCREQRMQLYMMTPEDYLLLSLREN